MEAEQKINQVDDSDDLWMARVEHVPSRDRCWVHYGASEYLCARVCAQDPVMEEGGGAVGQKWWREEPRVVRRVGIKTVEASPILEAQVLHW